VEQRVYNAHEAERRGSAVTANRPLMRRTTLPRSRSTTTTSIFKNSLVQNYEREIIRFAQDASNNEICH
jgi:hypothetical protein